MNKYIFILLGILFLFPTVSYASIDKSLKYGSQGLDVIELQEFLISKGFLSGQITGNFFSLTKNAVVAYQTSVGLPATGFVGSLTREKINSELSFVSSSSGAIGAVETQKTTTSTQNDTQQQIQNILSQIAQLNSQMMQLKQNTQAQVIKSTETFQNTASNTPQQPKALSGDEISSPKVLCDASHHLDCIRTKEDCLINPSHCAIIAQP